jgi:hypothetical protein
MSAVCAVKKSLFHVYAATGAAFQAAGTDLAAA